ncbi:MAG: tRNA (adenosine(37)-N6)-threonylcarbamoyltransferase complex dimerization subunit type 1 TsaB [Ilumatobacteraceae bacterium]
MGQVMLILGIDTSTDSVSVAIGEGTRVLAQSEAVSDRQHCEALAPMIDFVRQQAGVTFSEFGAIAVDVGPGLFTGLRVGVSAAKAIAFSLDLPIIGICSLDVLAAAAPSTDAVIVSVIDARRHENFWSMYRIIESDLTQVLTPHVGSVHELVVTVLERGQSALFVGNGALRYRREIIESLGSSIQGCEFADTRFSRPTAATVVEMAHRLAVHEQWQSADQLLPIYLRQPDADINWATRVAS